MQSYCKDFFHPNGPLAALAGYEFRLQQQEMADLVYQVINQGHIGVIEAGTGTGKSLAYLYPAISAAVANKEKIVISTNTINLQEQLLEKDIPVLKSLGLNFKSVVVKGWTNYPCWLRIKEQLSILEANEEDSKILEELDISLSQDHTEAQSRFTSLSADLREQIQAESDICIRGKCSLFNQCPVFINRRKAEQSDLIIVNHHLLLADVSVRRATGWNDSAVLPVYRHVIFDEAHHLEEVATEYFSVRISQVRIRRLLGSLYRSQGKYRGILSTIRMDISHNNDDNDDVITMLDWKLLPQMRIINEAAVQFFTALEKYYYQVKSEDDNLQIRYGELETEALLSVYDDFFNSLLVLTNQLKDLSSMLDTDTKEKLQPYIKRVESTLADLEFLMATKDKNYVFWLGLLAKSRTLVLQAAPIQVGTQFREHLLLKVDTAIFTSATLSVNQNFNYFCNSIGLDSSEQWDLQTKVFASPFNYRDQVYLAVAKDLPVPNDNKFIDEMTKHLDFILNLTKGRAFMLFTSYQMLNRVVEMIRKRGLDQKYCFLIQGELSRNIMINRFKSEHRTVLLGTDSFWEGVDVAGDALSMVILVKLPFKVPTDPIVAARGEYLREKGNNPFTDFFLPQAVLKFRQGCGRLIRTKSDRGFILICDKRIMQKSYGKYFLKSLPNCDIRYLDIKQILQEVGTWF